MTAARPISAIHRNGCFDPAEKIDLPENARVYILLVEPILETDSSRYESEQAAARDYFQFPAKQKSTKPLKSNCQKTSEFTMKSSKRHWLRVKFPFLPESADAVSYYLFARGALGCEEKHGCFFAYFEDRDSDNLLAILENDARQITTSGLKLPSGAITISRIAEQDWHLAWRRFFKPVNIENTIIVRPPWENIVLPENAIEIVIEPKQAFGTGTHATTKLMLRAIAQRAHALPDRALDVGTGSGILAIAHALLNRKAKILACDLDSIAIDNAVENSSTNSVADRIGFFAGSLAGLRATKPFPLIYANLQRHIILPLLADLFAVLAYDGRLLLSGILDSEENVMRESLIRYPFEISLIDHEDEWILIEASDRKRAGRDRIALH